MALSGTIEVDIAGPKRGAWRQWSGTAKGDPLAAIRFYLGKSTAWPEVWTWASRFTGIEPPEATEWTQEERRRWGEEQRRKQEEAPAPR